jgi:hypothetical protein
LDFRFYSALSHERKKEERTAERIAKQISLTTFDYFLSTTGVRKRVMKKAQAIFTVLFLMLGLASNSLPLSAQTKSAKKPVNTASDDDMKIRIRTTMEGQSFESTQYIKGSRERNEMSIGKGFVNITQCDLKRTIQINDEAKTYLIQQMNDSGATRVENASDSKPQPTVPQTQKRGGVVTQTNTITDTGERKQMFGFTARHLKTSMVTEASPDACNQDKTRMETDGWYIDWNYGFDCGNQNGSVTPYNPYQRNPCQDEYRVKNIGTGKLGFPLDLTTTIYNANGSKTMMQRQVLELSRETLDAALFDIPAGYTQAKDYQQLMGIPANPVSSRNGGNYSPSANNKANNHPATVPANASPTIAANAAITPKKANVIRIGVVLPKTQMGQGFAGTEVAEPVRHTLMQYLQGAAVEIIALDALVESQIAIEARQKECDYVLQTSVTQRQGGGGIGGFMRKASPVANILPSVGAANGTAGAVATAVATTVIYSTADMAGNFKAKDEVTFEFKLFATGNETARLANTLKAKAKRDGEDVLSPILEQAATAVLNAVSKR